MQISFSWKVVQMFCLRQVLDRALKVQKSTRKLQEEKNWASIMLINFLLLNRITKEQVNCSFLSLPFFYYLSLFLLSMYFSTFSFSLCLSFQQMMKKLTTGKAIKKFFPKEQLEWIVLMTVFGKKLRLHENNNFEAKTILLVSQSP